MTFQDGLYKKKVTTIISHRIEEMKKWDSLHFIENWNDKFDSILFHLKFKNQKLSLTDFLNSPPIKNCP